MLRKTSAYCLCTGHSLCVHKQTHRCRCTQSWTHLFTPHPDSLLVSPASGAKQLGCQATSPARGTQSTWGGFLQINIHQTRWPQFIHWRLSSCGLNPSHQNSPIWLYLFWCVLFVFCLQDLLYAVSRQKEPWIYVIYYMFFSEVCAGATVIYSINTYL